MGKRSKRKIMNVIQKKKKCEHGKSAKNSNVQNEKILKWSKF